MTSERSSPAETVLIVSNDVVDVQMAGPGIRCWEIAQVLAAEFDVILAAPGPTSLQHPRIRVDTYSHAAPQALRQLAKEANIIIADAWGLDHLLPLPDNVYVVADLYDPFVLENLELFRRDVPERRDQKTRQHLRLLEATLRRADFFICASERQRDFWLGALMLAGRVTPATYDTDRTLENLIDVVPFGLPESPPQPTGPFLRGRHPSIGENDRIIVWGGGIWEWLDPLTLIRAMERVIGTYPQTKLVFPGTKHPNPGMPAMRMREEAIHLAETLDLRDSHVFFGDWVPYDERANYLCEADIGVSLHHAHVETRMAFRTRFLDYVWARLPMVVSQGDATADLVERWGLGIVVPCEDVTAVADALIELLAMPALDAHYQSSFDDAGRKLRWNRVAQPLVSYCRTPYRAADADRSTVEKTPRADVIAALQAARADATAWRMQVDAYERGRFIRLMQWVRSWQGKLQQHIPITSVQKFLLDASARVRRLTK